MRPFLTRALSAAALISASLPAAAEDRPVVVELFTSQACSSCPPADALLGELAKQKGVLPLAFHVDYWNRLGWKDPYSSALATARQRAYAASLPLHTVYTPQIVIDGYVDAVGSDRGAVARGIAEAMRQADNVPLTATRMGDKIHVEIGAGSGAATLWLAAYDHSHTTRIGAGENGGRTLTEFNIVRRFDEVGAWQGAALMLDIPVSRLGDAEAGALLLQQGDGTMRGAATLPDLTTE